MLAWLDILGGVSIGRTINSIEELEKILQVALDAWEKRYYFSQIQINR